jgi:hypothetical protein
VPVVVNAGDIRCIDIIKFLFIDDIVIIPAIEKKVNRKKILFLKIGA